MGNLLRDFFICNEYYFLEIMSRKHSLRNRPRVLFSTEDEKELRPNVSTANPLTGASIFSSSDTFSQSTVRVKKNRHCSSVSEATTTRSSTPKRTFTSNTQDIGFMTQPPTPSKWSLLMPDFSSQMDGIRCDVMWDCSSPDAVKHLRKMQKNGSNPVKEIVRHVKDNQSVKAPPTPPLLSVILESRSMHIQKQPQQHNHISKQERVERRRVSKAEQVRQDAQVLLGKILSAVEKKQCFEDVLQQVHKCAGISVEPSNESGLPSIINSTDSEGKNDVEDTWDDDSLFEEDSFIIQATQNSELFINKLTHSTLSAHGKQTAIIAEETQLLSQTLELYCGRNDAGKIITTSPTLTETKTGTSYEENVNIGAEKTVTEKIISAPRVSHGDFQILCGASSGDLAESSRLRFTAKTKCLGKLGQRVDYKLDLSQQVMETHIHAQMLDLDPSVSCVTQLFSDSIRPATQVQQANSRKDVASVQQDCLKAYPCLENHSESETLCFRKPIGMTNKFHRAENIRSTHHGKQASGHNSNDKLQCCQMEAEPTSGYSLWKDSSSKCPLDVDKNSVRKCSNQNLPENMLLQIITIDDTLDSQVIEEYPTPLLTWPLMPETLARPTAPAADYNVDDFDDSYREGLESISQFESCEGLSQKGSQIENKKQYVVLIPEDSLEDDFPERENSAVLPRGPCGQNDCKQPKLCLSHSHKGVCSASQVKHGSKRSFLVFKGDVAFKGSMSELKNSASYKQNSKPFRDCIKITNGNEESDDALRKPCNFKQNWHESGPRVVPHTTLAKGNAMLKADAVAGRMTVLKPVNIVQSTSLLAGKPVAITDRLALQLPALQAEASVKEEGTSCNDDMMEFADEALFESQILALLDEVESQANQQNGLPGSLQSQSQENGQASFSSRICSQEEIEKKRQAALMRKKWSNARPAAQQ